jgi:hypothetical protein
VKWWLSHLRQYKYCCRIETVICFRTVGLWPWYNRSGTHRLATDVGFPVFRQHPCLVSPPSSPAPLRDPTGSQQVTRLYLESCVTYRQQLKNILENSVISNFWKTEVLRKKLNFSLPLFSFRMCSINFVRTCKTDKQIGLQNTIMNLI